MKFSISVPVGAYHPFLRACLESLKIQRAPVAVALLDASGDARVRALGDAYDAMLAYRRHDPDDGQAAAIAEGWDHTDGDVLGWLNADDLLFPDALARAAAALDGDGDAGGVDVAYGNSTILDEAGRMTGYHWSVEPPGDRLLESGIISQPSCFFRRDAYDRAGAMNRDLHYTMDWDLFIRIYKSGAQFRFIDAPLSLVLWGSDTKTASFNPRRREELKAIIAAHAPAARRKKIFRSFAIQNGLERMRPAWLKQRVERALVRGRKVIYGLAADGAIAQQARLHLVHYDLAPKRGVSLLFRNPDAVRAVHVNGAPARTSRSGATIEMSFDEPLGPGQVASLDIEVGDNGPAFFEHADWRK